MSQIKLFIGMPTLGEVKVETTASLLSFTRHYNEESCEISFRKHTYIHAARNDLAIEAYQSGATHLMFIDSDVQFPPHAIGHLLRLKKDIVGGLYFMRMKPHSPIARIIEDNYLKVITDPPLQLTEVAAVGTGFMLINMKVIERFLKVSPPFYYAPPEEFQLKNDDVEFGEDVTFCLAAREMGFKVWLEGALNLGHIGEQIVTFNDYKKPNPEHDFG